MGRLIDHTTELRDLAALASHPESLAEVLEHALEGLERLVPYDLAAVLRLEGDELVVRAARGLYAEPRVQRHRLSLQRFPTIRRVLARRRPLAMLEHHHASDEGDVYAGVLDLPDGHACMVVPLFAADRNLGIITLDRGLCRPYTDDVVELAGVFGQIVSLAILYAEQSRTLDAYRQRLQQHNRLLQVEVGLSDAGARLEASREPQMLRLAAHLRQVAATDVPVLVLGETGVGKELVAQAVHDWSPRRAQPLVKINCAAIPAQLVESELFGHVKGAFSGATGDRQGRFLTANGGTLLLDEIGELPLEAQAKLLRVLQEGTFEPVGSDDTARVDVRIIASTHVDLQAAVAEGRFREDLLYRLEVFPVRVPPLRDRRDDIVPIAEDLLGRLAQRSGRGPWVLSPAAVGWLRAQPWPGNVRQLANALERATILCPAGELGPTDFGGASSSCPPRAVAAEAPVATLDTVQRQHIEAVLRRTGGRIYGEGGAAELLGLKPTTLQSRMKKLGVSRPS